jgi:hypothetical protein
MVVQCLLTVKESLSELFGRSTFCTAIGGEESKHFKDTCTSCFCYLTFAAQSVKWLVTKWMTGVQFPAGVGTFHFVRFQVLTVASMKMTVFWDAVLCSLRN